MRHGTQQHLRRVRRHGLHSAPRRLHVLSADRQSAPLPAGLSAQTVGTTDQANHQYDTSDFFAALAAGNLPAVSYIKAPAYQDGHPAYSDPLDEQTFVVNTVNAIMQSPFWSSTAIVIAYDDSDGWYDHVVGPIVQLSDVSDDNFAGAGQCGGTASSTTQGRCGYGPRQPLLVISPYSKVNFVDHSTTDQSSILRFIEDNWSLGRIGNGSADAYDGSLKGMFNFNGAIAKPLMLDPTKGTVVGGGSSASGATVTAAIASPKGTTVVTRQAQLDGSASTSFDGKPLSYVWGIAPGSPQAGIAGGFTATPTVQFGVGRGDYTFQLTVTDSAGGTSSDSVTVTFDGN